VKAVHLGESKAKSHLDDVVLRDCGRGAKQQPAAEPHRLCVIAKAHGCEGRKCDQAAAANGNAGDKRSVAETRRQAHKKA
jgi:hypothetical protein